MRKIDTTKNLLENLYRCIENGMLTKGRFIEPESFVCFTQQRPNGLIDYHQMLFEQLPKEFREAFRGHAVGDKVASCKIIGIWDAWDLQDIITPMGKKRASQ